VRDYSPSRHAESMIQLSTDLQRSNEKVLDVAAEIGSTVLVIAEHVLRVLGLIRMARSWKDDAASEAAQLAGEFGRLTERVDTVRAEAATAREEMKEALQLAVNTRERWTGERRRAADQVDRAQSRVKAAQSAVWEADRKLKSAKADLDLLSRELDHARDDNKRISAINKTMRVQAARAQLSRAQASAAQASANLHSAQTDLAASRRRLKSCESAVAVADRSVEAAERASARDKENSDEVSRIENHHEDAKAALKDVEEALPKVGTLVREMVSLGSQLEERLRERQEEAARTGEAADDVVHISSQACADLETGADRLMVFDLPV